MRVTAQVDLQHFLEVVLRLDEESLDVHGGIRFQPGDLLGQGSLDVDVEQEGAFAQLVAMLEGIDHAAGHLVLGQLRMRHRKIKGHAARVPGQAIGHHHLRVGIGGQESEELQSLGPTRAGRIDHDRLGGGHDSGRKVGETRHEKAAQAQHLGFGFAALADRIVGQTAVSGILASLLARGRTGKGDRVDVPMFETMVAFVLGDHLGGLSYEPPLDAGGYARQLSPERRPYRTSDGYICALDYNDKQWDSFLRAVGRDAMLEDERFASYANRSRHIDFVYGTLGAIFEERSTAEWVEILERADVPFMPMHDLQSILQDPHLKATGFFSMVEHPSEGSIRTMRMPMTWQHSTPDVPRPAPRQGEHTREILQQTGYAAEEIEAMLAAGAAGAAGAAS